MILKALVIIFALYEVFKLLSAKEYANSFKEIVEFGKLKTEDDKQEFLKNMKNPLFTLFIVLVEFIYLFVFVGLLFTSLFKVALLILGLSVVISLINRFTERKYDVAIKMIDAIVTIGTMVYAFYNVL